ncbi:class I SAM-dependent methyltransferase [uncultured Friedmanniella sp.]|uniref:class I SAM-dependent methyltransferase n=1 Tax=uncultured Friedmanniella sp. TaxID=335381 RepID=UPI0035CAC0DD
MSFAVSAAAYHRFMGRFSEPLAEQFVAVVGLRPGQRALDVGCGPGALTAPLVAALGPDAVSAVDPSPTFVTAAQQRFPGLDVRQGTAEHLDWPDDTFDAAFAQLVVHFMTDPVAGLREMGRVTRPGGVVAACVWKHGGGGGPIDTFWRAALELDPDAPDEADLAGSREGHLATLCEAAGLVEVEASTLAVEAAFTGFDDWWSGYTLGIGPAGAYVRDLDESARARLRERCADILPAGPFVLPAAAWCVRAQVPGAT